MEKIEITEEYLVEHFIGLSKSYRVIGEETGQTENHVKARARKFGVKRVNGNSTGRKFRYPINESLINRLDPVFNYLAGLAITDGHLSEKTGRLHITSANKGSKEVLEALARYFSSNCPVRVSNTPTMIAKGAKPLNNFYLYSDQLLSYLGEFYGSPCGNKALIIGKVNLGGLPKECVAMLLRGIIDGDGSIQERCAIRVEMGSKDIIASVAEMVYILAPDIKPIVGQTPRGYHYIYMSSQPAMKLLDILYQGYEDLRYADKYSKYSGISI